ncbi:hypothetical protein BH10PSE1_BH10PSE1_30840 [soil metagenome]
MKKTALIACAALFAASAAPAFAGEAPRSEPRFQTARIVVDMCERDPLTQAALRNQHGGRPVFVTVDEVLSARASGERWTGSRCMTAREHQRLTRLLGSRPTL